MLFIEQANVILLIETGWPLRASGQFCFAIFFLLFSRLCG